MPESSSGPRLAYHQAGHAVARILLDHDRAHVAPPALDLADQLRHCQVTTAYGPGVHPPATIERDAMQQLAGHAAVALLTGDPVSTVMDHDRARAYELAGLILPPKDIRHRQRWVNAMVRRISQRLAAPDAWAMVRRLADTVLITQQLTSREVQRLVVDSVTDSANVVARRSSARP
jgi:hypothetical protein